MCLTYILLISHIAYKVEYSALTFFYYIIFNIHTNDVFVNKTFKAN